MMDSVKLIEYARAPGLSTLEKTQEVYDFLEKFRDMLEIYRNAYGEPLGRSVESHMSDVKWYLNYYENF